MQEMEACRPTAVAPIAHDTEFVGKAIMPEGTLEQTLSESLHDFFDNHEREKATASNMVVSRLRLKTTSTFLAPNVLRVKRQNRWPQKRLAKRAV